MESFGTGTVEELSEWAIEEAKLEAISQFLRPISKDHPTPNMDIRLLAAYIQYMNPTASEELVSNFITSVDSKRGSSLRDQGILNRILRLRSLTIIPESIFKFWYTFSSRRDARGEPYLYDKGVEILESFIVQYPDFFGSVKNLEDYIDPKFGKLFALILTQVCILPLMRPELAGGQALPCYKIPTVLPDGTIAYMWKLSPYAGKNIFKRMSLTMFDSLNPSWDPSLVGIF